MAAAAYWDITQAIKTRLDAGLSSLTPLPHVVTEEPFAANESWIGIYCRSRVAPETSQSLAAGTKTQFLVRFELLCWRFAMSAPAAQQLRDNLVGDAEIALMGDRTFGGTCVSSWLEGGRMLEQDDPAGRGRFFAGGEIILIVDTFARTT